MTDVDLDEGPQTCALDLADTGGVTLDEIGQAIGVNHEMVRQTGEIGSMDRYPA